MLTLKNLTVVILSLTTAVAAGYADKSNPMHTRVPLVSAELSQVKKAILVKPVKATTQINFVVWLKLRNYAKLKRFIAEVYDPNSPNYQKFLTGKEYESEYAPSADVENKVKRYFIDQGMQVKVINHSIYVTGTVRQIEHVFKIKMNYYRLDHRVAYTHDKNPTLNAEIAQYIAEVSGLNDLIRFYPTNVRADIQGNKPNVSHEFNLNWDGSFTPQAQPTTTSLNGFTGANLRQALGMNTSPLLVNGTGQTIIIIDGCGGNIGSTIQSDANAFFSASNIFPLFNAGNFVAVMDQNGSYVPYTSATQCNNGSVPTGWEVEIALDLESSHTIANGAFTALVMDPTAGSVAGLETALNDVVVTLIHNNHFFAGFPNASVVSNSWSLAESAPQSFPSIENVLQIAAASGIGFNFSSGDCGDNAYNSAQCSNTGRAPNYPSSSAFVTAVGGTSLFVDSNYNYSFESPWGTYINNGFLSGSGGGVSGIYAIPSPSWQMPIANLTAAGYGVISTQTTCGTHHNQVCRAVPDLAMLGDPFTGLIVYYSNGSGGTTPITSQEGGTSLACALYSGVLTLVNERRGYVGSGPLGLSAPYLYRFLNTFYALGGLNPTPTAHQQISGTLANPAGAPLSAFTLNDHGSTVTFNWDSSLVSVPTQTWNDNTGVGTPNIHNFVQQMSAL